jgi:DNA repair exonuclease SbcCD nuclease subunit
MQKPQAIKKIALFTDIHHGRRGNERMHNQDCLDFVQWFCDQVRAAGDVTHIAFLGDWFESRSAINIETLDFSYKALQLIDALGLPVYFIVGNHDLHRRTTRDVHSVRMFNELKNFTVVEEPIVVDNCVFSPFLFDAEYGSLLQHNDKYAWFGHFEFQGFAITGYNTIMEHGPDHKLFTGPKRIFSGHFHKRQIMDNVVYIGNAFPMDHGDAGDFKRGMCFYTPADDKVAFVDWAGAPTYMKINMSIVLDELDKNKPISFFKPKMKVKCVVDADIDYTVAQDLREAMIAEYSLRDFILEEDRTVKQGLIEGATAAVDEIHDEEFNSIDELVVKQLELALKDKSMEGKYDAKLMVDIYKSIKIDELAKDTK